MQHDVALIVEYSYSVQECAATAFKFLDELEKRIELTIQHPAIGKPSAKRKDVRSIIFTPHNQIFYRCRNNAIEILCLFDMRKNPKTKPC